MDHDHLAALTALLFGAPLAVIGLAALQLAAERGWRRPAAAVARIEAAGARKQSIALCLLIAGAIHLGLVAGHGAEPLLAASFAAAGAGLVALAAASLTTTWWRVPAALVLGCVVAAYWITRLAGIEGVDVLGLAACAIELAALALMIAPGRMPKRRPSR